MACGRLQSVKCIGPAKVRRLLDHFGDLAIAWSAAADELRAAGLDQCSHYDFVPALNRPSQAEFVCQHCGFVCHADVNAAQSIAECFGDDDLNQLPFCAVKPVLGPGDILEELNLTLVTEYKQARLVLPADETEQKLLACLSAEPLHVDEIGAPAEMPIAQVSSALALMELKGLVRQVGGMNYIAAKEARADYKVD